MAKWRCLHQWRDEAWTFTPPNLGILDGLTHARGPEAEATVSRWAQGFTTVTQRCSECQKVTCSRYLGRVAPGALATDPSGKPLVLDEGSGGRVTSGQEERLAALLRRPCGECGKDLVFDGERWWHEARPARKGGASWVYEECERDPETAMERFRVLAATLQAKRHEEGPSTVAPFGEEPAAKR